MLRIYYSSLASVLLLLLASTQRAARAQLVYPQCGSSWSWSFNSLGQSPCAVAAYLQGECDNGAFTIPDLVVGDYSYVGPTGADDASDLCKCNTVVYSLMSACDACQGANWFSWKTWSHNCTSVDPPQTFSNPIPNGTRVQEWAFLDVTKEGIWNPISAFQHGDAIEIQPGQKASLTGIPSPTTTQTAVPGLSSEQAEYLSKKKDAEHHSQAGKIAGIVAGVLCGVALVAASLALMLWRARVRRRRTTRAAAAVILGRSIPMQEKVSRQEEPGDGIPNPDAISAAT